MKKLLILKMGSTFPELIAAHGDFEQWIINGLEIESNSVTVCNVANGEQFPGFHNLAGVIISGSHAMVTEHQVWSEKSAQWLVRVILRKIPLLGICYGHQLIAYALGGQVDDHPNSGEYGTVRVTLSDFGMKDPLFSRLPPDFDVHVSHSQSIHTLPDGANILASSSTEPIAAFSYGNTTWGVQFHPEFTTDIIDEYTRRHHTSPETIRTNPERLPYSVRETPDSASILKHFADYCFRDSQ
jgi:GMP synthase (glutamine-hydrolysing)